MCRGIHGPKLADGDPWLLWLRMEREESCVVVVEEVRMKKLKEMACDGYRSDSKA